MSVGDAKEKKKKSREVFVPGGAAQVRDSRGASGREGGSAFFFTGIAFSTAKGRTTTGGGGPERYPGLL